VTVAFPQHEFEESGQTFIAQVAECSCNGDSDTFFIYWIAGLTHPHFQCTLCEQSYCVLGTCPIPIVQPEVPQEG
jgi:hypothetical protein